MDEPKEMLEELREGCIMQAKQEANEMSQQIDQKMEQEIQEQMDEYEKKQNFRLQRELKRLEKKFNSQKFEIDKEAKVAFLEKQNDIRKACIQAIEEKMKNFVQTEEYREFLLKNIRSAIEKTNGDENGHHFVKISITEQDNEKYANDIKQVFPDIELATIPNRWIGGCQCFHKISNVMIDNTIKSLIQEKMEA